MNDEPEVGGIEIPDLTISEGNRSNGIDLDAEAYFKDVDSSKLYFDHVIDPLGEFEDEKLDVNIDGSNNIMVIEALGDWYTKPGTSVRVRIYCDDDPYEITKSTAYQDIFIKVINLDDDAPVWRHINNIYRAEDEPPEVEFNIITGNYISDKDNELDELIFSVSNVSSTHVHVEIDTKSNVKIWSDPDYFGTCTVTLSASDGVNVNNHTDNWIS